METSIQPAELKIESYMWDSTNLKQKFEKTSMQIFHINQIKLADIQSELVTGNINSKDKEILVKIYSAFDSMHTIFKRLGIQDLYVQLRLVVNSIGKLALLYGSKPSNECKSCKNHEMIKQQQLKQMQCKQLASKAIRNKNSAGIKVNRMGGIALFNQSYHRNIENKVDQNANKQFKLEDLYIFSKNQQIERQEMNFYIERNKQLPVLKIKNNSIKYQQIHDQFSLVEERVRKIVSNLEYQFHSQKLKSFQFLTKQQISNQLLAFNQSMRSHLVDLKDQYNAAAEGLRLKNSEISNKLQIQIDRKNSMVNKQVQTVQTVASIKKIKKLSEEYQSKIQKLQIKLNIISQKQAEVQQKFDNYCNAKEKQLFSLSQKLVLKEEQTNELKKKCDEYESTIKSKQNNLINAIKALDKAKKQILIQQLLKNTNEQEEELWEDLNITTKQKINFQKISKSRTSLHSLPRNSIQINSLFLNQNQFEEYNIANSNKRTFQTKNQIYNNENQNSLNHQNSQNKYPRAISRYMKKKMTGIKNIQNQNKQNIITAELMKKKAIIDKFGKSSQNYKQDINSHQLSNNAKKTKEVFKNQRVFKQSEKLTQIKNIYQKAHNSYINTENFQNEINFKNCVQSPNGTHHLQINLNQIQNKEKLKFMRHSLTLGTFSKKMDNQQTKNIQKSQKMQTLKQQGNSQKKINYNRLQKYSQNECLQSLKTKSKVSNNQLQKQKKSREKKRSIHSRYSCNVNKYIQKKDNFRQLSQHYCSQMQRQGRQINQSVKQQQKYRTKILEIQQQFPELLKLAKQNENRRKFFFEMQKIHKMKCKSSSCSHIEAFNKFFTKFKNSSNQKIAIKLHIQNFQSV